MSHAARVLTGGEHRLVLCPAHARPLARMAIKHAVELAQACPWCKVQHQPAVSPADKMPDPIVFGPQP